jgi:hypothetical protein
MCMQACVRACMLGKRRAQIAAALTLTTLTYTRDLNLTPNHGGAAPALLKRLMPHSPNPHPLSLPGSGVGDGPFQVAGSAALGRTGGGACILRRAGARVPDGGQRDQPRLREILRQVPPAGIVAGAAARASGAVYSLHFSHPKYGCSVPSRFNRHLMLLDMGQGVSH